MPRSIASIPASAARRGAAPSESARRPRCRIRGWSCRCRALRSTRRRRARRSSAARSAARCRAPRRPPSTRCRRQQRRVDGGRQRGDRERVARRDGRCAGRRAQRVVDAEQVHLERPLEHLRIAAERSGAARRRRRWRSPRRARRGARPRPGRRPRPGSRSRTSQMTASASPHSARDLRELVGLDPGERDAGAAFVQPPRDRRADPARGAGDQHPPARTTLRDGVAARSRPAALVGLDPQARDRRREHLVVPDEHHQLDQLSLAQLAAELRPTARRTARGDRAARRRLAAAASWRGVHPSASGPSVTRVDRRRAVSPRGAPEPLVVAPLVRRSRCCGRRGGSRARCRRAASVPRGISAPANRSHARNRRRWRASVVNRLGGRRVPAARPITPTISALMATDVGAGAGCACAARSVIAAAG